MENMRAYTISVLNDLIDVCRDEYSFFNKAAKKIEDEKLKNIFQKYASEKNKQLIKLETEVIRLGGNLRDKKNELKLQQSILNSQPNILRECLKKDDAVMDRYSNAINEDILWEVIPLVAKQYFNSKSIHDGIFTIYKDFNQPVPGALAANSYTA